MSDWRNDLAASSAEYDAFLRGIEGQHGPGVAEAWQRAHYVVINEGTMRLLMRDEDVFTQDEPTLGHLPWSDCVLDFQRGANIMAWETLSCLAGLELDIKTVPSYETPFRVRVCLLSKWARGEPLASAWPADRQDLTALPCRDLDAWLVVEAWGWVDRRSFYSHPRVAIVPRNAPWDPTRYIDPYPDIDARTGRPWDSGSGLESGFQASVERLSTDVCVRLALLALVHASQRPTCIVEVQPNPPIPRGHLVAASVPRRQYILIDPSTARIYGLSDAPRHEERASPRPHWRRGYRRVLRHPRYYPDSEGNPRELWIRPTRVGGGELPRDGQSYLVVDPD